MSKQIFFPSNPKHNINKIFRNNTEIDDDIKSFLNISEDSSQSKGYDIYEPSLDRVLPIFFEDDNKEKTKEKSNEIGYPCQQDNQENQENQEKKKIIDVDFIEKVQQKIKENITYKILKLNNIYYQKQIFLVEKKRTFYIRK